MAEMSIKCVLNEVSCPHNPFSAVHHHKYPLQKPQNLKGQEIGLEVSFPNTPFFLGCWVNLIYSKNPYLSFNVNFD